MLYIHGYGTNQTTDILVINMTHKTTGPQCPAALVVKKSIVNRSCKLSNCRKIRVNVTKKVNVTTPKTNLFLFLFHKLWPFKSTGIANMLFLVPRKKQIATLVFWALGFESVIGILVKCTLLSKRK